MSSVSGGENVLENTTENEEERKSLTPNLDKVMQYANDNKKTKLVKALKRMYEFVGADDLKESFARSIQYHIGTNVKTQVRRSKRRRYAVRRSPQHARKIEVEDDQSSDSDISDTDIESGSVQEVLFKLIIAEKIKTMLGRDNDDSDSDDSYV